MLLYIIGYLIASGIGLGFGITFAVQNAVAVSEVFKMHFLCMTFCGLACALAVLLVRKHYSKHFNMNARYIKVHDWEKRIFKFLGVKRWKKLVPDMGWLAGFNKNLKKADAKDKNFYYKFIYESVVGEKVHFLSMLLTPLFFLFLNAEFRLSIGLSTFIYVEITHLMPFMIQRYNRPRLLKVYESLPGEVATEEVVEVATKETN